MLIEIYGVLGNVKFGVNKRITSREINEGIFIRSCTSVRFFAHFEGVAATQGYGLRKGTGIFKMNTEKLINRLNQVTVFKIS